MFGLAVGLGHLGNAGCVALKDREVGEPGLAVHAGLFFAFDSGHAHPAGGDDAGLAELDAELGDAKPRTGAGDLCEVGTGRQRDLHAGLVGAGGRAGAEGGAVFAVDEEPRRGAALGEEPACRGQDGREACRLGGVGLVIETATSLRG